jgi:hypothetical protein
LTENQLGSAASLNPLRRNIDDPATASASAFPLEPFMKGVLPW